MVPISATILKRKWGWIGHTFGRNTSSKMEVSKESLDWNPHGKRKRRGQKLIQKLNF